MVAVRRDQLPVRTKKGAVMRERIILSVQVWAGYRSTTEVALDGLRLEFDRLITCTYT